MKFLLEIVLVLVLLSFGSEVLAQAPPPGGSPAATPLDGFTSLLLAGGVGYGIKVLRQKLK